MTDTAHDPHDPHDPHAHLRHAIAHAAHMLPAQGPIATFVHHNTLHAFEHLPFHDALEDAKNHLHCAVYLSPADFQAHFRRGRIDEDDLKFAFEQRRAETLRATSPLVPGLSVKQIEMMALLHDIQPIPPEALRWEIQEHGLLRHFDTAVPANLRQNLILRTSAWVEGWITKLEQGRCTLSALIAAWLDPAFEDRVATAPPPSTSPPSLDMSLRSLGLRDRDAQQRYVSCIDEALRARHIALDDAARARWIHTERTYASGLLLTELSVHALDPDSLRRHLKKLAERWSIDLLWHTCKRQTKHLTPEVQHRFSPDWIANIGGTISHRDALRALTHQDPAETVNEVLIRLCAAYLDEGMALWAMPNRAQGFLRAWQTQTLTTASAPRPSWQSGLVAAVQQAVDQNLSALDIITRALHDLGVPEDTHEAYIERILLQLPGWAGMFNRLEQNPGDRSPDAPPASLHDYLAVRLTYDLLALHHFATEHLPPNLFSKDAPLSQLTPALRRAATLQDATTTSNDDHDRPWRLFILAQFSGLCAPDIAAWSPSQTAAVIAALDAFTPRKRLEIWQEAYEQHYRRQLLDALALAPAITPPKPEIQVAFCIDDREESIRRHLEALCPAAETFGIAGFFGVAIDYQGLDDGAPAPLCPVVVTPAHTVHEVPVDDSNTTIASHRFKRRRWLVRSGRLFNRLTRSMILGALLAPIAGLLATIPLLSRVVAPRVVDRLQRTARDRLLPGPQTRLQTTHSGDHHHTPLGHKRQLGFTPEEQAARVAGTLENMGLTRNFAPFVVMMGHGSVSVNNPHMSAYDCGACGGKHGGPNARLFADMANNPEVRAQLRTSRNIDIPDSTWFIGAMHNTCTDDITLFDLHAVPPSLQPALASLQKNLDDARKLSAQERCRRFASAPKNPSPSRALRHVEGRAVDLSQARPELGHVTNASCIVGRRSLSRALFLDRRAFLVSYDPDIDPTGRILERILAAVGPVGAGINLEYYFSCVDNLRLGCGSKLPHNLTSLLGVMDGSLSDLRTGLPRQMIEIHEPIRLQVVVEAEPQTLLDIVGRQPELARLIGNGWIQVISISPATGAQTFFIPGQGFVPWDWTAPQPLPSAPDSLSWYQGHHDFLPPALIKNTQHTQSPN